MNIWKYTYDLKTSDIQVYRREGSKSEEWKKKRIGKRLRTTVQASLPCRNTNPQDNIILILIAAICFKYAFCLPYICIVNSGFLSHTQLILKKTGKWYHPHIMWCCRFLLVISENKKPLWWMSLLLNWIKYVSRKSVRLEWWGFAQECIKIYLQI